MADIIALHNTTPRRLRFANKLGGMPCPSIAYINTDHLYHDFGEISLLLSTEAANPAKSSLYVCDSDIYSGRFPTTHYSVDERKLKELIGRSIDISKHFSNKAGLITRVSDFLESNAVEEVMFAIHRFPELFLQFEEEALEKRFSTDDWQEEKVKFRCELSKSPRIQEWVNKHLENNNTSYIDQRSEDISQLKQLIVEEIDVQARMVSEAIAENATSNYMKKRDFNYFKNAFLKDYFGTNDVAGATLNMTVLTNLEADFKVWSRDKQPLDIDCLEEHLKAQEPAIKAKFERWLIEKLGASINNAYFYHETPSGNVTKKELTLENVTKSMKRSLRGGENFHYGAGNVRAQVSNQFKKWRSIEEKGNILSSSEEFENAKKEINERFSCLIDDLLPFYKFQNGNPFGRSDEISRIISEYAGGRFSSLEESFNIDDDFPKDQIDCFIRDLKNAPTQYFEGKFKKEVLLSDFAAAVIPNDIAENESDIMEILKENNIPFVVYDPDIKRDRERKIKAIGEELNLTRKISEPQAQMSINK